jgi:hypothetical protein
MSQAPPRHLETTGAAVLQIDHAHKTLQIIKISAVFYRQLRSTETIAVRSSPAEVGYHVQRHTKRLQFK